MSPIVIINSGPNGIIPFSIFLTVLFLGFGKITISSSPSPISSITPLSSTRGPPSGNSSINFGRSSSKIKPFSIIFFGLFFFISAIGTIGTGAFDGNGRLSSSGNFLITVDNLFFFILSKISCARLPWSLSAVIIDFFITDCCSVGCANITFTPSFG